MHEGEALHYAGAKPRSIRHPSGTAGLLLGRSEAERETFFLLPVSRGPYPVGSIGSIRRRQCPGSRRLGGTTWKGKKERREGCQQQAQESSWARAAQGQQEGSAGFRGWLVGRKLFPGVWAGPPTSGDVVQTLLEGLREVDSGPPRHDRVHRWWSRWSVE